MSELEKLEEEFSELRDSLAALDVKIENIEQGFIRQTKCSPAWFKSLEKLNDLQRDRQILVSSMVTARLQIEKLKTIEDRKLMT